MQRMRATSIRPHIRKGDLGRSPLLQQELVGRRVEEKDGEGAVENSAGLGGGEFVRGFFGFGADDGVGW